MILTVKKKRVTIANGTFSFRQGSKNWFHSYKQLKLGTVFCQTQRHCLMARMAGRKWNYLNRIEKLYGQFKGADSPSQNRLKVVWLDKSWLGHPSL